MAKFCTKCGKKLEEVRVCDCLTDVKDAIISEPNKRKDIDFQKYLDLFFDVAKGIFMKPIDTIKKYATEENFDFGVIAIFLNSIIFGIMFYFLVEESMSYVNGMMGLTSLGYGLIYGEISFFKILVYAILFMAVFFFGIGIMIHFMNSIIFKGDSSIKRAISLVGVCSVLTTVTSVVGLICLFVSIKLFGIVVGLAGVLYLCHLYHGVQIVFKVDENKQGYIFLATIVAVMILVSYVLPEILF
ncbi:MAG: YIP1 family protein [Firmicutes bacterium]|nr:YIP1 family protein [Bacillota bacterium]